MERVGLKYGLLTAAAFMAYFQLMDFLGLTHIVELRFLNGLILAVGVVLAIKALKIKKHGDVSYFQGLGVGVITSVVGSLLFALFMVLYLKLGDAAFVDVLMEQRYLGDRMTATPGSVIFIVLMLEGLISGFMISFIAMQFFKRRNHQFPNAS